MECSFMTMGMKAQLWIPDFGENQKLVSLVKNCCQEIDERLSTFVPTSEVALYNEDLKHFKKSNALQELIDKCEETKIETGGYFDAYYSGKFDPAGLVKGLAIERVAKILTDFGCQNFMFEIAGDLQTKGLDNRQKWKVGIENPFNAKKIIKTVNLAGEAIATSSNRIHKNHIINPVSKYASQEIASISVINRSIYDADRMATAAFAMGVNGINFIQGLDGYEGYLITNDRKAIMTTGFEKYV